MSWKRLSLGSVVTLQRGFDLPSRLRVGGPYPIVSSGGITGYHIEATVKGPGVITGRYGSIGEVHYIDDDFWPLNTSLWAKDFHGNSPKFVYHLLQTLDFKKFSDKTGVPGVNRNDLHKIIVSCPPLAAQLGIVEILDQWDVAIENMNRLIVAKTRHNIDFKYKLLFGKARLGGRKTKGFFAKPWFSIPNDWLIVTIGSIAKEVSTKNRDGGDIPVLSCTKYQGLVDSLKYFDKQIFSKDTSTYKVAEYGQFAYATNHVEEGSIGYQNLYPKGLVSPMYTVFQTDQQRIIDSYLYKLLKTETYRHIFQVNTSASVDRRGSLRWGEFSKLSIPLPSLDEQKEINEVIEIAQKEIDLLILKVALLKKQKRGLMQKLLTGEWQVKTAGEVS